MIYWEKGLAVVRTSEMEDVEYLADHLRLADKEEIWASNHHTPHESLLMGLNYSLPCLTLEHDEVPVCMFGVVPEELEGQRAAIWLLGSDKITEIKNTFLRLSRLFIPAFLNEYPILYNYIDIRNTVSKDWLEWCGAKFEEPKPYGTEGKLFQKFTLIK